MPLIKFEKDQIETFVMAIDGMSKMHNKIIICFYCDSFKMISPNRTHGVCKIIFHGNTFSEYACGENTYVEFDIDFLRRVLVQMDWYKPITIFINHDKLYFKGTRR